MTAPLPRSEPDLRELREALTRAVRRACPPALNADIDDIVQRALIKLHEKLKDGDLDAPPPAYLWRLAHHAMIDALRSRTRRASRQEVVAAASPRVAPDLEAGQHRREISAGIHDCLQRLNDDRRQAVAMYLAGHSAPELVELLGWPRKRVENLVFRGLAQLRTCLERKGLRP